MNPAPVLSAIVDLELSYIRHLGTARNFGFGPVISRAPGRGSVATFALHVDCPWRFCIGDRIVVGSFDKWDRADDGDAVEGLDEIEPAETLEHAMMADLFGGEGTTEAEVLLDHGPRVIEVRDTGPGSFVIAFEGDLRLEVFAVTSRTEAWRFFRPGAYGDHLVFENGRKNP